MDRKQIIVDRDFLYEAASKNRNWFTKPMRYGNLTWVENDPEQYDIDWWIQFLKETHTDVITLSVGGIVAYYPTQVPFHYKSKWLNNRDMVGEFMMKCRENGIYVIARIDPHAFRDDMAQAHPEWIAVDRFGKKRRHWDNKELWVACTNGGYVFEYLPQIIREIMTLYMPDAIFSNRYEGSGICYCDECKRSFKKETGLDMTDLDELEPYHPHRKAYDLWAEKKLFERWNFWDAEVKKINPNGIFSPNVGTGTMSMMNLKDLGIRAERVNVDKQGRSSKVEPLWSIGRTGKIFNSIFGNKPVAGGYSVGPEWGYRWKDAVQSIAELRLLYADGLANGMHPSWGKFSGKLYDFRWVEPVKKIFQWHYRNEKYFKNVRSLANVGLIYHQVRKYMFDGMNHVAGSEDAAMGMYHALVEARIPFDLVHQDLICIDTLKKYKLIIMPSIPCVTEEQCQALREYVQSGGSLIATFETSLYDENGKKRDNFELADIFGVDYVSTNTTPLLNSYINIEPDSNGEFHPVTRGLENAGRIINGPWQVTVREREAFPQKPLTLIPSYPSLPMEDVYPRYPKTDIASLFLRDVKGSRVAYFPWDIDRNFWETYCEDHFIVLKNTVKWALEDELPVEVTGHGMVDVTAWEQDKSMTVHIVNITNPMMIKGPCRELLPLADQTVKVKIPGNRKIKGVNLLVSVKEPLYSEKEGELIIHLPPVLDHEVIAIDFL